MALDIIRTAQHLGIAMGGTQIAVQLLGVHNILKSVVVFKSSNDHEPSLPNAMLHDAIPTLCVGLTSQGPKNQTREN